MCGILGYCGYRQAVDLLLVGLKRLEYRGYDSAGICINRNGELSTVKRKGKIKDLREIVPPDLEGYMGIGHTRWATHGEVTDANAHPHSDSTGSIVIVHNGIIENYQRIKAILIKEGHTFRSDTDSEVISNLIASLYKGNLESAVREAVFLLKGTYGLAVMHKDIPDKIVGVRNGSPLVVGVGDKEMFLASDITAIIAHTKQVIHLEDKELVVITPSTYRTFDFNKQEVQKKVENVGWNLDEVEKNGYRYFMEKEIYEQPDSILNSFIGRIDRDGATGHLGGLNMTRQELINIKRIQIVAAGTSYYAGMIGAYLIEGIARIPARTELASEIRYKNPVVEPDTLYFVVSQSGETADTLYAMEELQRKGARVLGICNVVGSTIPRKSDGGVYIHSGPEIAVASTKAFTSQITVFYILTLILARMRHFSFEDGLRLLSALESVPNKLREILKDTDGIKSIAKKYSKYENFLFLGRGLYYSVALEGALKLKEISYIHAEGYSSAEIKHGPIALINENTPSLFLVPNDSLRDKVINNIREVKARGGKIIAVAVKGDDKIAEIVDDVIWVPSADPVVYPYLMVIPLQLFAFYVALELKRDVDQPRNLAKCVTVE